MNFDSLIPVAIIYRIRALRFQLKPQQKDPIILYVDIVDKMIGSCSHTKVVLLFWKHEVFI